MSSKTNAETWKRENVDFMQHFTFNDGECTTEFRTRLNRRQAIWAYSLQKIWILSHSIPISTKIRLMKALVWPVATYGCESWTLRKKMKKHVLTPLR